MVSELQFLPANTVTFKIYAPDSFQLKTKNFLHVFKENT